MALNLSRLNARQREAVLHGEGPLLVLAGAGSGKTSTMAYRIAHLVAEKRISPTAILGLSFTNKAAGELKERVTKLITEVAGKRGAKGLTVATFHSLCVRILRAHADRLGYQTNFTIVDQNDQKDILKQIFRHIKIDDRKFDLDTILFEIGHAKNKFMTPEQAERYFLESKKLVGDYGIAAASSFVKYQEQLRLLNAMDFDDLLYNAVKLLEKHADVRDQYNLKFRYLLVDEYQDTNPAQFKLLRLLTEYRQNICVVGDDDQSIYAWRGADPTHILEFGHHFPGAKLITLDQNYRSVSTILDAANGVIGNNSKRHAKQLWSERGAGEPLSEIILDSDREEAEFVAEEILRRQRDQNRLWKDFAILYRSNAQSRIFEEALRRNQIPYKIVGGMSFLERKEVKDALSYLRLVANPKDDASLRRVLNWPARGIGKTTIEALGNHAFQNGISFFEALSDAPALASRGAGAVIAFRDLILELRRGLEATPPTATDLAQWGKRTLERINARKAVEEDNDDPIQAARKWENVEELIHSLGQMKAEDAQESLLDPAPPAEGVAVSPSTEGVAVKMLREFLTRMALDAQEEEDDRKDADKKREKDQVTLLTLHGAKGLEFPVVFLVGMEEGFLPHRRTIEEAIDFSEERRLCYVGITRAKDHLLLTRTQNRIRFGKAVPRTRSRFMDEVPKQLLITRNESSTPDLSTKEQQNQHEEKVSSFLSNIRASLLKSP